MTPNLPKLLTFFYVLICMNLHAQEVWTESFSVPNKGIWGDPNDSTIHSDFSNITSWTLNYDTVELSDENDYAKTVNTSGGRFECRDINGEVIWYSQIIDISSFKNVQVILKAAETGSGNNSKTKYLKASYILDQQEHPFESSGENTGNFGESFPQQTQLNGNQLQIAVRMRTDYSNDKIILDEIQVSGKEKNPISIKPGDVLLSEILFNPVPGGADYVEIFNHSEKYIPLKKILLASRDKNLKINQICRLTTNDTQLVPGAFLALTDDTAGVIPWFNIQCPHCILQMEHFPSFNNDDDYVVLLNDEQQVIDELRYDEDMHSPLLYDWEGIALERLSFEIPSSSPLNWHSASSEAGYGTPGYTNSQSQDSSLSGISVEFSPEAFSPNNDNYNDLYHIRFKLDKSGYIGSIRIFDRTGNLVRTLRNNFILGTHDEIYWNGNDDHHRKLPADIYIVHVELFHPTGGTHHFKDGVVLTNQWK